MAHILKSSEVIFGLRQTYCGAVDFSSPAGFSKAPNDQSCRKCLAGWNKELNKTSPYYYSQKEKSVKMKKPKVNLNQLAKDISYYEGGKKNLSIAQIKEVLNCLGYILAVDFTSEDVLITVAKLMKAGRK